MMLENVGLADRVIRVVVGAALVAFALYGPGTGYDWIGWIGVVPILTAIFKTCPLYAMLGLSTAPKKHV